MSLHRFLVGLVGALLGLVSSVGHAISVDCGANQSFTAGLGGWGPWWSGSTPVVATTVGRTDTRSLRLQGNPGTATRVIQPTECPFGIAYVSYYARAAAGSAYVYTKFVDQVTGAVLFDSINTAPTTVGTTWVRITIPVVIANPTLIGIAAQPVSPATTVTTYVDDVIAANDACANQSFATTTGGFAWWWSGNNPVRATTGRTDAGSLRLSGTTFGTAFRNIAPSECAQPLGRIGFYAKAEAGSAWLYPKLVDQVTGAVLWDANTGPIAVTSTAWTRVVVDVPMPNTTLLGIAVQPQSGTSVSVLIDDVMLNPGGALTTPPQPDNVAIPARSGWVLSWSDDFSAATLDPAKWATITTGTTYESSTEGFGETWGDECFAASQVAVSGGALQLTARQQSVSCKGLNRSWQSGLVVTRNRFSQTYGRFEARMKYPVARGSWPAFWMMPQANTNYGSCGMYWPCVGEIDILEYVGNLNGATNTTETSSVYGTLHWGDAQGGHVQEGGVANITPTVNRWTVYAVEWDTTGISFFVDDTFYKRVNFPLPNSAGVYTGAQPFDKPFYMILNQSVGGGWAGPPDPTHYPNTVKVDYVAVYRRP